MDKTIAAIAETIFVVADRNDPFHPKLSTRECVIEQQKAAGITVQPAIEEERRNIAKWQAKCKGKPVSQVISIAKPQSKDAGHHH